MRAQTTVIVEGEIDPALETALQSIGPAEMYDIIDLCESDEDIAQMLLSIQEEYKKRQDLEDAREIFRELDFQNIGKEDLEMICSLLREFDFDEELFSILKSASKRSIRFLTNLSYKAEKNIVILLDEETSSPWFYLEGQVFLKMKEIPVENTKSSNERYFKGITFGEKKGILTIQGDNVHNQVLDTSHSINGSPIILIEDIFGGGHHIYLTKKEKIIHMSAVVIGIYYEDNKAEK